MGPASSGVGNELRVACVARRLVGRSWGQRARRIWGIGARGLGVSPSGCGLGAQAAWPAPAAPGPALCLGI